MKFICSEYNYFVTYTCSIKVFYDITERVGIAVNLYRSVFEGCSFRIAVGLQAFLTQEFRRIPQSLNAKLEIVPWTA
jgi:hypothetical protein